MSLGRFLNSFLLCYALKSPQDTARQKNRPCAFLCLEEIFFAAPSELLEYLFPAYDIPGARRGFYGSSVKDFVLRFVAMYYVFFIHSSSGSTS